MSTNRSRFTIPVFPHVKKFIQKKYQAADVVKTEEYTTLGKMVTLALRDNRRWTEYNTIERKHLSDTITLHLTSEQLKLSPKISKLMRINLDMDREFKSHLVSWIHAGIVVGIKPFNSCKNYLSYHRIDEREYSLDAAYKFWQRYKRGETISDSDE
jgi:hypothetical protein